MGQLAHNYAELELCPECGQFVDRINDYTGWCDPCSGITPSSRCAKCNNLLGEETQAHLCSRCKYLVWLENNADEIERVMATEQVSAAKAKQLVKNKNRPICLSCHKPIKGGTSGRTYFCTKTAKCRKAINAYRYYKHKKNCTHEDSVKKALEASTMFNLINTITRRSN